MIIVKSYFRFYIKIVATLNLIYISFDLHIMKILQRSMTKPAMPRLIMILTLLLNRHTYQSAGTVADFPHKSSALVHSLDRYSQYLKSGGTSGR